MMGILTPAILEAISYGLRRMRWRGLARAAAQVHFTATAYNLKRCLNILSARGGGKLRNRHRLIATALAVLDDCQQFEPVASTRAQVSLRHQHVIDWIITC